MQKKSTKRIVLFLISAGVVLALAFVAKVILLPLLLALIFCYLLVPIIQFLEKLRLPTVWAILLVYGVILSVLILSLYWGMPRLLHELTAIGKEIPKYVEDFREFGILGWQSLKETLGISVLPEGLVVGFEKIWLGIKRDLTGWVANSLRVLPSFFGNLSILIFAPVMTFYFLRDRRDFCKQLKALFPPDIRENMLPLAAELDGVLRNFVKGYVLVAVLVGILFYFSLLIFGIDYALTLGVIMAFAELIPYFGPFIAFVPSLLLVLLQGPQAVIKLIIVWLVVQQLENLVISPKIMSNSVYLHPLPVMVVVLIGGYWFGVLGMILAVPLAAILKLIFLWCYRQLLQWQGEKVKKVGL